MADIEHCQSPLLAWVTPTAPRARWRRAQLTMEECALAGQLNLRGDAGDARFSGLAESVIGLALPRTPNTFVQGEARRLLWLAPDEWLLQCESARIEPLQSLWRKLMTEVATAITDVTHGSCMLRLQGPDARRLLAFGCPLDLHPRVFAPGQCAQSHYLKAPLLIVAPGPADTFDLVVRRSFADYLWSCLVDATEGL